MKKTYEIDTDDQSFGIDNTDYLRFLLCEEVIFINNGWWYEKEGRSWHKDHITVHMNCNDVFAWGCADAEDVLYGELKELTEMHIKDKVYGTAAWAIKKRKQMPQPPVAKAMRAAGYNLEELIKEG